MRYLAPHIQLARQTHGKRPGTVLIISQTYIGSKHKRPFSNANAEFIAKRFTYFGFDVQRVTLPGGQIKPDLSQTELLVALRGFYADERLHTGSRAAFVFLIGHGYQRKADGAQMFGCLNPQNPDRLLGVPVQSLEDEMNVQSDARSAIAQCARITFIVACSGSKKERDWDLMTAIEEPSTVAGIISNLTLTSHDKSFSGDSSQLRTSMAEADERRSGAAVAESASPPTAMPPSPPTAQPSSPPTALPPSHRSAEQTSPHTAVTPAVVSSTTETTTSSSKTTSGGTSSGATLSSATKTGDVSGTHSSGGTDAGRHAAGADRPAGSLVLREERAEDDQRRIAKAGGRHIVALKNAELDEPSTTSGTLTVYASARGTQAMEAGNVAYLSVLDSVLRDESLTSSMTFVELLTEVGRRMKAYRWWDNENKVVFRQTPRFHSALNEHYMLPPPKK
ncbi:hypothetical protein AAVH_31109 [Aphelenchoides avenae]|nr:hypothetical protein AAVH_31109 [Aphelenchus avenae]